MARTKKKNKTQKSGKLLCLPTKVRLVVIIAGLLLVGIGVNGARNWYTIRHAGVPAGHTVATESTDRPSEQPVPDNYSVPADKPLSIQLPSIKTEGFIQQVGIDKNNQMVVPSNVHMAGWYTKGALPGATGLSIIDGHVQGLYARGVFKYLDKLKAGDSFTVTYGDKSIKSFKVKALKTVGTKEADTVLYQRDNSIAKQLNLITCTGQYEKSNHSYDSRVIVVAEAI